MTKTPEPCLAAQPTASPNDRSVGPILFFGNVPFRSDWQRAQYLALGLAEHTDVVYVDPNRSVWSSLRQWWKRPSAAPSPVPRLRIFTPAGGLPLARSVSLFNAANHLQTSFGLTSFLRAASLWPPRTAVMTFPDQWDALRWLPPVELVYDIMDDHNLFLGTAQQARYERLHRNLLGRAGVVTTSAQTLLQRYRDSAARVVCIGNGVRQGLVAECAQAVPDPALSQPPRPRFGYVGHIGSWFDFDAVRALAEAFPHGSVILVGPTRVAVPPLPRNVHLWGPVPHLSLPGVLKTFDVGLIPFNRCAAIDVVNPVKLYEYCAAGLPILCSTFTEVVRLADLIGLYDGSPASCVAQAHRLLAEVADAERQRARVAFAQSNTWTNKAAAFYQILRAAREEPSSPTASARAELRTA